MELVLNVAWVLLAACMAGLWLRHTPRSRGDRRMQLVALAVLLLILFPVISVTDDLQAIQNAAESDCCQRRNHAGFGLHTLCAWHAAIPVHSFTGTFIATFRVAVVAGPVDLLPDHPALQRVQNRPPPFA